MKVVYSPDGRRIASSADDSTARLWYAASGKPIGVLRGHNHPVMAITFSSDGTLLATGSEDKSIRLWDAESLRPVAAPLRGHAAAVSSVAFSPDGGRLVSGGWDGRILLWDIRRLRHLGGASLESAACAETLPGPLSHLQSEEFRLYSILDPALDADDCQPPRWWAIFAGPVGLYHAPPPRG